MPVQGAHYKWMWGIGWDTGGTGSIQINFRPTDALALVSLSTASGEGMCTAGISEYRTRNVSTGVDEPHVTGDPKYGWPPLARDPNMTSVTATLMLGARQIGVMTLIVWFT